MFFVIKWHNQLKQNLNFLLLFFRITIDLEESLLFCFKALISVFVSHFLLQCK